MCEPTVELNYALYMLYNDLKYCKFINVHGGLMFAVFRQNHVCGDYLQLAQVLLVI